jgi:hypothetical protein
MENLLPAAPPRPEGREKESREKEKGDEKQKAEKAAIDAGFEAGTLSRSGEL